MSNSQTNYSTAPESPNLLILALIVILLKMLLDFKVMGGFNYPLLVKLLYMIIIGFVLMVLLHPEEMKRAVKQSKIEDYFKKQFK